MLDSFTKDNTGKEKGSGDNWTHMKVVRGGRGIETDRTKQQKNVQTIL